MFSRDSRDVELHLVPEVLDLCAACDNALSVPGGSLLLAGSSGVGRRVTASVVAAMHRAKLVAFAMGKGFGVKQFRAELKGAMQAAGVEGEQAGHLLALCTQHQFLLRGRPERELPSQGVGGCHSKGD